MEALEVVQRRATKRIPRLRHICYEERLRMLDLIALKKIRIRRDVIQQFKIEHGLDLVNWGEQSLVKIDDSIYDDHAKSFTHANRFQMIKENCKDENFFYE